MTTRVECVSRTDELVEYIRLNRAAFDGWPAGAFQVDWGGDAGGFRVKLTRSDRIGGKPKVDHMPATA